MRTRTWIGVAALMFCALLLFAEVSGRMSGRVLAAGTGRAVIPTARFNMTGLHLLPDGSVAVGCYRAYSGRAGTALFEISRDRRLVWKCADAGGDTSMMAIQRLDESGKPLPGRCLR